MSKDFATILDESIDYLNNSKCLDNQYEKIIKESESLIKFIKEYDNNRYNNKEELKKVIGESLVNVIETHAEVSQELDKLAELLIIKNADYGSSFFDVADDLGVISIAVRMSDKVNRLKQLTQGSESVDINVSDESIEDTVIDLEGYMLLSICWLNKKVVFGLQRSDR